MVMVPDPTLFAFPFVNHLAYVLSMFTCVFITRCEVCQWCVCHEGTSMFGAIVLVSELLDTLNLRY